MLHPMKQFRVLREATFHKIRVAQVAKRRGREAVWFAPLKVGAEGRQQACSSVSLLCLGIEQATVLIAVVVGTSFGSIACCIHLPTLTHKPKHGYTSDTVLSGIASSS